MSEHTEPTHGTALFLPCPHCGGRAKASKGRAFVDYDDGSGNIMTFHSIDCTECGIGIERGGSESRAVSAWNARAESAPDGAVDADGLNPCPRCGSHASLNHTRSALTSKHYIKCDKCGAQTDILESEAIATALWNERAIPNNP